MEEFFEYTKALRPTVFPAPPRILNILYHYFTEKFEVAKLAAPVEMHEQIEKELMKETAQLLGNRVKNIIFGGAQTGEAVRNFIYKYLIDSLNQTIHFFF